MFRSLFMFAGLILALPAFGQAAEPARLLSGEALVKALRDGGYTIFFRHAKAPVTSADIPGRRASDGCETRRNLSEAGRVQSRQIGEQLAALGVVVGEVLANPHCHCVDTALLMTGRVKQDDAVLGKPAGVDGPPDYGRLREIVATPPARGTVRIIVGQGGPWADALGFGKSLAEGEGALLKGPGRGDVVARILPDDWSKLPR